MALEAVKEITGAGASLAGKLWLFDGLSWRFAHRDAAGRSGLPRLRRLTYFFSSW